MKRWARRILVTCSMALFLATMACWVRSQWLSDYLWCRFWRADSHQAPSRALWLITHPQGPVWHYRSVDFRETGDDGAAEFARDLAAAPRWVFLSFPARDFAAIAPDDFDEFNSWVRGHFAWQSGVRTSPRPGRWGESINGHSHWYNRVTHRTLAVPWWSLAVLLSLAPARALWTWQKSRRRPPHLCPTCGYDLRATSDSAGPRLPTCPECGRPTAAA